MTSKTVSKKYRGTLRWWLFGFALLPIAVYGCFPVVATTLVTEGFAQQGFQNITIRLGYPSTQSLPIHVVAFTKEISGERYQVTLNDIGVEYELSELINGQLQRIVIGGGTVVIKSSDAPQPSLTQNTNKPGSTPTPTLTVDELLAPFPMPPFEQLILGTVSLQRSNGTDPLQHILVHGSAETRHGSISSQVNIQGDHIPPYTISLSGKSIGEAQATILSPTSPQTSVINFTSHTTRIEENIQVQGSLNIDIPNVTKLVELFVPLDRNLSQITGTITADWRGTLPPEISVDTIVQEKVGTIDGTLQVQAAMTELKPYAQGIVVQATSTFSATHDELTWVLSKGSHVSSQLEIDPLVLPESVRSIIPMDHHRFSFNIAKPVTSRIRLTDDSPSLTVDGLIQGDYTIKNLPVTINFSLDHLTGRSLQDLAAHGQFLLSGTLETQRQSLIPVQQVTWDFSGDLSLRNEKLTVEISPKSSLQTALLPIDALHIPKIDLTFLKKLTGEYELATHQFELSPLFLKINTPHITWSDKTLTIQRINLTIDELEGSQTSWETAGKIVVLGIDTTINDITPPTTNWKFQFSANPQILRVNLLGQTADKQISLYGKVQQQFLSKNGSIHLKLAPVTFASSEFNIRDNIQPWPYPLDLTAGQASSTAEVFWTLAEDTDEEPFTLTKAKASMNLDNLGGHYENMIFDGLSTTMTIVGTETWSMPTPMTLMLDKLETGVNISDISMRIHLNPIPNTTIPRAEISALSAQMFGGNIFSDDLVFDLSQPKQQLTLHAQALDINEILKLEQQEGLHGTGLLDGTFPVTLTENGVEVHDGTIAARAPGGIIQYRTAEETAETLKQTSDKMNVVLQALNNFHYDKLSIGADYDHTGRLLLATKLEGKNPDLYNGKRIHFNLNVEENIPALLKSLQVAKDIEGRIEELLQRSEEKILEGL